MHPDTTGQAPGLTSHAPLSPYSLMNMHSPSELNRREFITRAAVGTSQTAQAAQTAQTAEEER